MVKPRALAVLGVAGVLAMGTLISPATATPKAADTTPTPGAPGIGDPYFPTDGNGGYDAQHYDLRLGYNSNTGRLAGTATMTAKATQSLSSFNLDLDGMSVKSVKVDGRAAAFTRASDELTITPTRGLPKGTRFKVAIRYGGVPASDHFLRRGRGAVTIGEPHGADAWFPNNDHPADKATYRIAVTAERGQTVVSNGHLVSKKKAAKKATTWTWASSEPMASYLATVAIGDYKLNTYKAGGKYYTDVIADELFRRLGPKSGQRFLLATRQPEAYQYFGRTVRVPANGATMSFAVNRQSEYDADFFFVAARPAGTDQWTTLRDLNGNSSQSGGTVCEGLLTSHPHLKHFLTGAGNDTCTPTGTTGTWNAAAGSSRGWENWKVDLKAYAGKNVQLAFGFAADGEVDMPGVAVDNVKLSTGTGSTSFEKDGNRNDGWAGVPVTGTSGRWRNVDRRQAPKSTGQIVEKAFAAQSAQIGFYEKYFGPYPFRDAGGLVDDFQMVPLGWARQTRSIYPTTAYPSVSAGRFWQSHEIAHQWFGDSVSLERWSDIWLNEGIGFYASWMWREHKGLATTQDTFDRIYSTVPATDPFWKVSIASPGADGLFQCPVFVRGPMTMQQLRNKVGDRDFFTILRTWTAEHQYGNATTEDFISLSKRISGQDLDSFFQTWLYSTTKPTLTTADSRSAAGQQQAQGSAPNVSTLTAPLVTPRTEEPFSPARYPDDIAAGRCFNAGLTPTG